MKRKQLLAGFPGVGKTRLNLTCRIPTVDHDLSAYWKNRTLDRETYISDMLRHLGDEQLVMVNTYPTVRQKSKNIEVDLFLVYPDIECDNEYFERFYSRGESFSMLKYMALKWCRLVDGCKNPTASHIHHVVLQPGEFLTDRVAVTPEGFELRPRVSDY